MSSNKKKSLANTERTDSKPSDNRPVLIEPMIFYDRNPSDPNAVEMQEPMEYYADSSVVGIPVQVQEEKTVTVDLNTLCVTPVEKTPSAGILPVPVSSEQDAGSEIPGTMFPTTAPTKEMLPDTSVNSLSDMPQEYTEQQKKTALMEVQKILRYLHFINWNNKMYCFDGQVYMPVSDKDISRILLEGFMDDFLHTSPMYMQGVLYYLERYPSIHRKENAPEKNMVAFQNCVLNTVTGEILAHSPEYLLIHRIEAQYLPHVNITPTDHFDHFLYTVSGGDSDLTERIWQFIGYCLTPDVSAKAVFLLQGVSHSGKSVLSNLLRRLFSDKAVLSLQVHALSGRFNKSELQGKALCVSADMPSKVLDGDSVSIIKQLSGDDELSGEVKHEKLAQFETQVKLVMATNHPLLFKNPDAAMINRIVVIPFRYSVSRENWDTHLTDKILAERDGIVTKAIAAYFRLRANRYYFAGTYELNDLPLEASSLETADIPSLVLQFLTENCERCEDSGVFSEDLYALFSARHHGIAFNTFMYHCINLAKQQFHAEKERKRRPGEMNPISYIRGIKIKNH